MMRKSVKSLNMKEKKDVAKRIDDRADKMSSLDRLIIIKIVS